MPRRAHRARLAALCALAVVSIAVLSGNVFSVHVGMAAVADQASLTSPNKPDQANLTSPRGGLSVSTIPAPRQEQPPQSNRDLQHLMHLMGACLGLLAAGGLLLALARRARQRFSDLIGFRRRVRVSDGQWPPGRLWRAPPLSPPTSSPVIRT